MEPTNVTDPGAVTAKRPAGRKSDATTLAAAILDHLLHEQAILEKYATRHDWYMAVALAVRDRMLDRYMETVHAVTGPQSDRKVVAYLSAEFLTGPHLGNNLLCLGIRDAAEEALAGLGQSLADLLDQEEEPGLGNGGLGRLAACYMDSLAALDVPAVGYGIRYEFGIFDQAIRDGWQVEVTDKWLRLGNPWEIARPEIAIQVPFGGRTEQAVDESGRFGVRWLPARVVKGVPYDTPVPGYLGPPRTCSDCGGPRPSSRSTSRRSTSATTTGPSTRRSRRKPSRRCSIRTTSRRRASSSVSRSSSSSSPARSRT